MNSRGRSAHQLQRVGKELRSAEIARFQGKQHIALVGTDGAQNRHACSDFRAYEESGNTQAIDDGA